MLRMATSSTRNCHKTRTKAEPIYFVEDEYLVTALVPSDTACLANSPGRMRRTLRSQWTGHERKRKDERGLDLPRRDRGLLGVGSKLGGLGGNALENVWMNQQGIWANGREGLPLTNEFRMDMARLEIPVSGWTCLRTGKSQKTAPEKARKRTLVDVRGVGLLSRLGALLLLARGSGGLLASLLLLGGGLAASRGLAGGGGGLLSCLGSHLDEEIGFGEWKWE
jgi:hypothetical protein